MPACLEEASLESVAEELRDVYARVERRDRNETQPADHALNQTMLAGLGLITQGLGQYKMGVSVSDGPLGLLYRRQYLTQFSKAAGTLQSVMDAVGEQLNDGRAAMLSPLFQRLVRQDQYSLSQTFTRMQNLVTRDLARVLQDEETQDRAYSKHVAESVSGMAMMMTAPFVMWMAMWQGMAAAALAQPPKAKPNHLKLVVDNALRMA